LVTEFMDLPAVPRGVVSGIAKELLLLVDDEEARKPSSEAGSGEINALGNMETMCEGFRDVPLCADALGGAGATGIGDGATCTCVSSTADKE
jgi:hypothetical protein